jgi:hypothetical protein
MTSPDRDRPRRFDVEPYRVDGGFTPLGLILVFLVPAAVGAALGCAVSWVGQWFYVSILFPVVIGGIVAISGAVVAKFGHVRNAALSAVAGLVAGVVTVFAFHEANYQRAAGQAAALGGGELSLSEYFRMAAEEGQSFVKIGPVRITRMTGSWAVLAWLIDAGIILFTTTLTLWLMGSEPYCRECGVWKVEKPLANLDGVPPDTAAAAVRDGDLATLLENSLPPADTGLKLYAYSCPRCGDKGSVVVRLMNMEKDDKGNWQRADTLANVVYPGEVLRSLPSPAGNESGLRPT